MSKSKASMTAEARAVLPVTEDWDESDWEACLAGGEFGERARFIADGSDAGEMTKERIRRVVWMRIENPEGYADRDILALAELTDGSYAICTGGWDADFYKGRVYWGIGPDLDSVSVIAELPPVSRDLWVAAQAEAGR